MAQTDVVVLTTTSPPSSPHTLSNLRELEAESIHIIREVAAEFENPVMLYSIGKDSSVMVRLAEKAFYPGKVPFPLMHIDSKWKFREMVEFRDRYAKEKGWDLIVHSNWEGFEKGVGPFTHGSKVHTDIMKTQALLEGLTKYKFDAAFGGARRDEEKSRAKERIFSFRDRSHQWDPKNQRPELWNIYNARVQKEQKHRGIIAICSFISPCDNIRRQCAQVIGEERFHLFHMDASLEYCSRNKPELYRKAEEGLLNHLPGVDEKYEVPENTALKLTPEKDGQNTERIIEYLSEKKVFPLH